jgi:RNA polymerase sigma-70 factor (ECF subfamily)
MLFGTAFLMTRDRQLAEDAVQEALIKMWKHIRSLRKPAGLKAWLASILVNEVRQQARRRQTPIVLEEMPDPPASDESVAGSGGEVRQDLERAIRLLPPEQREAVILRFFSDLTVPEVAAATRSREGTVKSRLSRAMDSLGRLLPGYGHGEGRV